jgi:hypothetical protein
MRRWFVFAAGLMGGPLWGGAPITIPFEFYANAIWLTAQVNGRGPFHMQFDTAAGRTVLNTSKAKDAGLAVLEEFEQANAGSGDKATKIAVLGDTRVEFGGVRLEQRPLLGVPLDEVATSYGVAIDGIVGFDLMAAYVVKIDFDKRTLTLYDPASFAYDGQGAVVPLELHNHEVRVKARVEMPGREAVEGVFLLDEPHPGAILFAAPFVARHDLLSAARSLGSVSTGGAMGVGGKVDLVNGRVGVLQIGPYRMARATAGFPQAKGGAFARSDIAGIVGGEVWRRFRVWIDCARSRVILEPGQQYGDAFESDAVGVRLKSEGTQYERVVVAGVNEGSPAARAGLERGDVLLGIDGQAVPELKVWGVRKLFMKAGRKYEVRVRRAEKESTCTVVTEALY